jgi:hypothetical protein
MAQVPNTPENAKRCICGNCPSYPADGLGFYCATGKSPNEVKRRGCICGDCANWQEYLQEGGYFCAEGAAV